MWPFLGRWKKHEELLDPDDVAAGQVTRFRRADPGKVVSSRRPAHPAIVSVETFTEARMMRRARAAGGLQARRKLDRGQRASASFCPLRGRGSVWPLRPAHGRHVARAAHLLPVRRAEHRPRLSGPRHATEDRLPARERCRRTAQLMDRWAVCTPTVGMTPCVGCSTPTPPGPTPRGLRRRTEPLRRRAAVSPPARRDRGRSRSCRLDCSDGGRTSSRPARDSLDGQAGRRRTGRRRCTTYTLERRHRDGVSPGELNPHGVRGGICALTTRLAIG